MDLGLQGKACLVTGASRGIGLATARLLAAEGASILLVARDEEALRAAAAQCGDHARILALDVTDPSAAHRAVERCQREFGGIDALVNNAGATRARPMDELTDGEWQAQWELHVMAPMRFMREAAPRMEGRGAGRIVNVCSSSGKRPSLTNVAYSVTKAAQLSLSRAWSDAWAPRGVLVNAVAPGPVDTGMWLDGGGLADQAAAARGVSRDEALAAQRAKIPLGRFGTEDEIAAVIAFLCSRRAANVAGAAWSVDGGAVPIIL
jgi:NAD(P)-dependent dehydrogenase (short-subunit alcohol dehydrogenase family)